MNSQAWQMQTLASYGCQGMSVLNVRHVMRFLAKRSSLRELVPSRAASGAVISGKSSGIQTCRHPVPSVKAPANSSQWTFKACCLGSPSLCQRAGSRTTHNKHKNQATTMHPPSSTRQRSKTRCKKAQDKAADGRNET